MHQLARHLTLFVVIAVISPRHTCADPPAGSAEAFAHWEIFTVRDGLPHDSIRALHIVDDTVWVGTDAGPAQSVKPGWRAWTRFDADPHALTPAVSSIEIDPNTGDLWLGTFGNGLYRFTAGRFDRFDQLSSGLAGDFIFDLAVAHGSVWAATNGGVSVFNPRSDTWSLCAERAHDRPEQVVVDLSVGRGDTIEATVWREGLTIIDSAHRDVDGALPIKQPGADTSAGESSRSAPGVPPALPSGRVRCEARSSREIWMGTSAGLVHGCVDAQDLWGAAAPVPVPAPGEAKLPVTTRIGVLSPANPTMPLPGRARVPSGRVDVPAVQLAVEEANARIGETQVTYALVHDPHGYARYGWTLPEDDLATFVFREQVAGVVAWVEPGDRFTAAVARELEIPIANAAPTRLSAGEGEGVWIFSSTDSSRDTGFETRYRNRFHREPPPDAARSYHAARRLIDAVEAAGADREGIVRRMQATHRGALRGAPPDR